ncbi:MAG: pyridoxamine 5'-phosphate oxidase [Saprospiraceae bacterium]|uniref:Pyridoxine/pyridoxamine 5'-phosphate oxidase n=1 Tax=Candidatus Opimibacter skivensis TaxID=2982028 RepID=A0A9D7SYQ3_9BACT|nr:pyridoxamine 5'-phosphate oxidase [Candidatus Opimibacter skivensis]
MKKIEDIRKSYQKGKLDLEHLDPNPIEQFLAWWDEAVSSEILEPNAMTLATVDKHGRPSARIVLLKGVTHDGFEFYTNYQSDKAKDIEENPKVALVFLWKELERQVRIEGVATKLSKEKSETYFHSRPRGSQIGSIASPQSEIIPDRKVLDEKVNLLTQQFENIDPIPYPEFWGGYNVEPHHIEFWQGRHERLHDRFRYSKNKSIWTIDRLAP